MIPLVAIVDVQTILLLVAALTIAVIAAQSKGAVRKGGERCRNGLRRKKNMLEVAGNVMRVDR